MTEPASLSALQSALADELAAKGHVTDDRWLAAFRAIPRDAFVPYFFTPHRDRPGWHIVRRPSQEWAEAVYSSDALITQLDGHDPTTADTDIEGGTVTSSSSAPSLMGVMLEALNVHDGHRTLEVGTGTGYNAGLLCHRLGDSQVASVDVDAVLVERARQRLAAFDYHPHLHTGDGREGSPEWAPYDRIIATVGITAVPRAWVDQTRDGGKILAPFDQHGRGGLLTRLTVSDGRAEGPFLTDCGWFMGIRSTRRDAAFRAFRDVADYQGAHRTTALPVETATDAAQDFAFFLALRTGGYDNMSFSPDDGGPTQTWLADRTDAWVCHTSSDGDNAHHVRQGGPSRLWDRIEAAHDEWRSLGEPTRDRFGLTVEPDGAHTTWLDEPNGPNTWHLEA
ncbi:MAG: ATP-grasp peptide maturase system methyltransferase [Haloechinothrix sp.]